MVLLRSLKDPFLPGTTLSRSWFDVAVTTHPVGTDFLGLVSGRDSVGRSKDGSEIEGPRTTRPLVFLLLP